MKINILEPHGYCNGVKKALKKAVEVLKNPESKKPIYLLGAIIHNYYANKELKDLGAIIIENKNMTRLETLDFIEAGTVIISAHGASPKVFEKAKNKGLDIIDVTCPSVKKIHNDINKYLQLGYTCYLIGKPSHPECEGILGISDNIKIIDENNLILDKNSYITNQSTLSKYDTELIYNKIKDKNPTAIINNNVCNASSKRQEAIINNGKTELCIIVGDSNSSNTKRLFELSKSIGNETIFVENIEDIKKYDLYKYNSVSITSGASTPEYILNEIIEFLKTI